MKIPSPSIFEKDLKNTINQITHEVLPTFARCLLENKKNIADLHSLVKELMDVVETQGESINLLVGRIQPPNN